MKEQILIKRYAQGLINSIANDQEFKRLYQQLEDFNSLLDKHQKLKDVIHSPFLPLKKRIEIAKQILLQGEVDKKILRFVLFLLEHGRVSLLSDILELMPILWDEKKGVAFIEVTSAVPLTGFQKKQLKGKLELLEGKSVSLKYKVDPKLLAGFSLRKGNIVYDVSLRGSLDSLKDKICQEQR